MNLLSKETEDGLFKAIISVVERTIEKSVERHEDKQRYLKSNDAAVYCGVSKQTLTIWVNQEGLKQIKVGNLVSYDRKDLDHFMIQHKI